MLFAVSSMASQLISNLAATKHQDATHTQHHHHKGSIQVKPLGQLLCFSRAGSGTGARHTL
jgi:hypothetical protein